MTSQELKNYRENSRHLEELFNYFKEELLKYSSLRAIDFNGLPKGSPITHDIIGEQVALLDEKYEKYKEKKEKQNKLEDEILEQLELIDAIYRRLLLKRYLENKSYNKIAYEMGYSIDHIFKLHRKALIEFDKVDKKNKKK